MPKAILFDNDGVLVDTEKLFYRATKEVMSSHGFELCIDDFLEYFLKQNTGLWHVLAGVKSGALATEDLRAVRDELFMQYLLTEDVDVPGVSELLEELSLQYSALHLNDATPTLGRSPSQKSLAENCDSLILGVVTSSQLKHFRAVHSRTGFEKYFDFVLAREDYLNSKPHPEPYLLALERAQCSADQAIVIEDSPRGVAAALAAGIECWVVASPFTEKYQFPDGVRRIESWGQVGEWVRQAHAKG